MLTVKFDEAYKVNFYETEVPLFKDNEVLLKMLKIGEGTAF